MNDQQRIKYVAKISEQADRTWHQTYRELLASFSPHDVLNAIVSYVRLHEKETVRTAEPSVQLYVSILEKAFITLWDREAINNVSPITSLGQKDLDRMRVSTGIGVEELPAPAPVLSPEEQLANEVKQDWKTLPSAKIKQKISASKAYRAMFEKLSATDAINSQVTLHSVIDGVGT